MNHFHDVLLCHVKCLCIVFWMRSLIKDLIMINSLLAIVAVVGC